MTDTYHVDWDDDQVPGVPLMAVILTTRGAAAAYLPALNQVPPERQPAVAEHVASLLRQMADQMTADLALFRAVEDAMATPQGGDAT